MYGQRQLCFVQLRLLGELELGLLARHLGGGGQVNDIPLREVLVTTNVSALARFASLAGFGMARTR
jgi:hypothetical protein